jgi:hypothetical protein
MILELWSAYMLNKRRRIVVLCVVALLTLYIILPGQPSSPSLPPLPGTYQYFTETDFHSTTKSFGAVSHCDTRFAPKTDPGIDETRRSIMFSLESYVATMNDLNVETWIAHGALIGWYWNKRFLPWDTDVDVHVSVEGIKLLAQSYNMTEYRYPANEGLAPRTYLLDINPHYTITSTQDVANKIDARWIDKSNGKFIDITAVHRKKVEQGNVMSSTLFCKDGHEYQESDVYPLQESKLEGVKVKVPVEAAKLIRAEYGKKVLTNDHFHWHRFNRATNTWEFEG